MPQGLLVLAACAAIGGGHFKHNGSHSKEQRLLVAQLAICRACGLWGLGIEGSDSSSQDHIIWTQLA